MGGGGQSVLIGSAVDAAVLQKRYYCIVSCIHDSGRSTCHTCVFRRLYKPSSHTNRERIGKGTSRKVVDEQGLSADPHGR